MELKERNLIAFSLLDEVLRKGAYSSIELNKRLNAVKDERDKSFITRLFYGVLSKNVQLDYVLSCLAPRKPKPAAALAIKMGVYVLRYMSVPEHAVYSAQVDLMKAIGKKELSGFVNAVLRKSATVTLPIRTGNKVKDISVNYSCPEWIVSLLIEDYGDEFTKQYLGASINEKTHVRPNLNVTKLIRLREKLPDCETSECGLFVTKNEMDKLSKSSYVIQSLSSCLAVKYYSKGIDGSAKVLDLCAAPGGKSVYLKQLTGASVTACDVHEHRVSLIRSYASATNTEIEAIQNDATVFRADFEENFDAVICDVPCSGLGVIFSKPDVMLSRVPEDVRALSDLQKSILSVAARYVKRGGLLCYSTCTVTKAENEDVITDFLSQNSNFSIEKAENCDDNGYLKLLPQTHGCDGFFVVRLRRKN